jgi:hypothetical protein
MMMMKFSAAELQKYAVGYRNAAAKATPAPGTEAMMAVAAVVVFLMLAVLFLAVWASNFCYGRIRQAAGSTRLASAGTLLRL